MSDETKTSQTLVPDAKGCIRIKGYEEQVKEFQTSFRFYKKLDGEMSKAKESFRDLTMQALSVSAPGVKRVEFMSDDGQSVPVTVPDYEKPCNRNSLDDKKISEVVQKTGVDVQSLAVTEKEECFILTGEFVGWLRQILHDNYTAHGKPIPGGIEFEEKVRLSPAGMAKLEKMARDTTLSGPEQLAAQMLLKLGKKAPSVSG
jgi:hypothetical protein